MMGGQLFFQPQGQTIGLIGTDTAQAIFFYKTVCFFFKRSQVGWEIRLAVPFNVRPDSLDVAG